MRRLAVLVAAATIGTAVAPAAAQPLDYVVVDPVRTRAANATRVVYLNRCAAGCTATAGADDAARDTSSILGRDGIPSTVSLDAFRWGQATWDGVVACVRERYAPLAVTVVTEPPTSGRYQEVMVAGVPGALALPSNTLGVAPLTSDCSALPTALAFAFANVHPPGADQIDNLCTTIIHEAGHLYGLDHEHACKDPMTYLNGCTPKTFVNRTLPCGELAGERPCQCGAGQNSFATLLARLGPGAAPAAPTTTILAPAPGATVPSRFSVFASVDSPRQIVEVALWINGRSWVRVGGRTDGNPYELVTPPDVPDGELAIEVRTRDDVGNVATATVAAVKGAACTTAATCAAGQACTAGACVSAPGTAALGDRCSADEDCAGRQCTIVDGAGACSQPCWPVGAACGDGLECRIADDEGYACLPLADDGGCCSTGGDGRPAAATAVIALAVLTRRRRRRSRAA